MTPDQAYNQIYPVALRAERARGTDQFDELYTALTTKFQAVGETVNDPFERLQLAQAMNAAHDDAAGAPRPAPKGN